MNNQQYNELTNLYNLHGDGPFEKYECLSKLSGLAPTGIFVEVGFRNGTGTMSMISGRNYSFDDLFIAIDPYGNIPYSEGTTIRRLDYTNEKRKTTLFNFYSYLNSLDKTVNFVFFNLESSEFMHRFSDGIPDYFSGEKQIRSDYSLVHLDGQHNTDIVLEEVKFFAPRILPTGFLALDNTEMNWMDMSIIEKEIFNNNFIKSDLSVIDKWVYIKND
jgi:hypothetical protein